MVMKNNTTNSRQRRVPSGHDLPWVCHLYVSCIFSTLMDYAIKGAYSLGKNVSSYARNVAWRPDRRGAGPKMLRAL